MTSGVLLRPTSTEADLAAVRRLCWAYRDHLLAASPQDAAITEAFYPLPRYTALMERLAQAHARPGGIILLATVDEMPVGCGMSHGLSADMCEIKRVFVEERARGKGIAAKLCTGLEDQARRDGYRRLVLDTSKSLHAAQRLYARLGFRRCPPYQPIPEEVRDALVFYEKQLGALP